MARILTQFVEPPRACAYLPDRPASLEYRVMTGVGLGDLEAMLVRGWRRMGRVYFRPACGACGECVSIRVPVDRFVPTGAQLRARRRCGRFRVVLARPQVDEERLALYAAWHATRERDRAWEQAPLDASAYTAQFGYPHPAAWELSLRDGDRLVAVTLCDITPRAWSAIFGFYSPEVAHLSPGVAAVVLAVELARQRGVPHVYLGFRVLGCASMRYKAGYRPHELLEGLPGPDEEPRWIEAPSP